MATSAVCSRNLNSPNEAYFPEFVLMLMEDER
jgi:hypothetical protein